MHAQELEAKEAGGAGADGKQAAAGAPAGGGRLRAFIDTVIGNLELRISNIHIRYEDATSYPGHTFSIGLMLQEISGHTVDVDGKRTFVTGGNALKTLRKVSPCCLLRRLPLLLLLLPCPCMADAQGCGHTAAAAVALYDEHQLLRPAAHMTHLSLVAPAGCGAALAVPVF